MTQDEVSSHDDVIAVVRSTRNDQQDNVAHGDKVELIAPGVSVFSTRSGDSYGTSTGTSFAAPCAAGCAALALSVNPRLTRDQLRQIMRESADKIGGVYDENGHNDYYGFGRVNARKAVQLAGQSVLSDQSVLSELADRWHLDEVTISIAGRKHWLWRAVDRTGVVLDNSASTPPRSSAKG